LCATMSTCPETYVAGVFRLRAAAQQRLRRKFKAHAKKRSTESVSPTREELELGALRLRVDALEETGAYTSHALVELERKLGDVENVSLSNANRLRALERVIEQLQTQSFAASKKTEQKMGEMEQKMEQKMGEMQQKMEQKMGQMEQKMDQMDATLKQILAVLVEK